MEEKSNMAYLVFRPFDDSRKKSFNALMKAMKNSIKKLDYLDIGKARKIIKEYDRNQASRVSILGVKIKQEEGANILMDRLKQFYSLEKVVKY